MKPHARLLPKRHFNLGNLGKPDGSEQTSSAYLLTLEPLPDWPTRFHRIEPEQRLRALLKRALRNWGLKCTEAKQVPIGPKEQSK